MRYPNILISALAGAALFSGCGTASPETSEPQLLTMSVLSTDGASHYADIDNVAGTAVISSITRPGMIKSVKYTLSEGASISPDPAVLTEKYAKENLFTLKSSSGSRTMKVIFPNFNKDGGLYEPDPEKWQLVWSDDFDGTDFNRDIWAKVPRGRPDWQNTMASFDELFDVSDGILTLWGIRNISHHQDTSATLTGGLWSRDIRSVSRGRIDIMARYDSAKGFWPALWLRPQNPPVTGDPTEIDILEHVNTNNLAHQTVHSDYTMNVDKVKLSNTKATPLTDINGWHVYSVEIHEDKVVFLIDNKETYTYPKLSPEVEGQFPFHDRSYYIILSAQLGGRWPGTVNLSQLPVRLQVDYVKHYLPL